LLSAIVAELLEVAGNIAALDLRSWRPRGPRLPGSHGISATPINKLHEAGPHIADASMNGEIQLVVNTPIGRMGQHDDSYIRKTAIKYKFPIFTTLAAALPALRVSRLPCPTSRGAGSLQSYHRSITASGIKNRMIFQ